MMHRAAWIVVATCMTGNVYAQTAAPAPVASQLPWTRDSLAVSTQPLTGDEPASAIEITDRGRIIYGSRNGYAPQSIAIIWQRKQPGKGPDLVIAGRTGPDQCCLELTVVNLAATLPVQIITLATKQPPAITEMNGTLALTVPFTLEGSSPAAHQTTTADLPVRWDGARFAVDTDRLGKLPPQAELRRRLDLMRAEMAAWTITAYESGGDPAAAAPKTRSMLLDLILSGQAHAAKTLLYQAWPLKLPGREIYWRDLSIMLKSQPLWNDLGLSRLPNTNALGEP